ncbi:MAG: hypothetical protein WDA16_03140 [Candidatus Thermoplasmatota archaeon]
MAKSDDPDFKALAAVTAEFIEHHRYDTKWGMIAAQLKVTHLMPDRLVRSQGFHDEDYPDQVRYFLGEVYDENPETFAHLVQKVVGKGTVTEGMREEYSALFSFLEHGPMADLTMTATVPALPPAVRYLDVDKLPDDFYRDLVELINRCYRTGLYSPQLILMRKLAENLVIDVLRRKYGAKELGLYYDASKKRFVDFSVLITNIESKLSDFAATATGLDKSFVTKLHKFRTTGNSNAHSIDVHVKKADLDAVKADLTHIVKLLSAVYDKTPPA